jgi:serine protease Do
MQCATCGNEQLIRDGQDWYCRFCHTRTNNEKITLTKEVGKNPSMNRLLGSVLRLHVEDRVGTGFVISPKGLVLTNQHIVLDQETITGSFDDSSEKYSLKVLYQGSDEMDLCLLKIVSSQQFEKIPFAKHPPALGEEVSTIGNPRGIGLSVSKGHISRLGDDGDLQLNIQLNPGNSGGPLLNQQGELLGIISFLIEEIQAMSFAIGLPQIEAFIEQAKGGQ